MSNETSATQALLDAAMVAADNAAEAATYPDLLACAQAALAFAQAAHTTAQVEVGAAL